MPASAPCRTLLFFHAGGFTSCSTADHLDLCVRLADAAGAEVVSIDYRSRPGAPVSLQRLRTLSLSTVTCWRGVASRLNWCR
ncbi:MAG TPA: alpha/beta hydrolase fold domain-containing protein [Methanoculleus sp.]|nr:alpha/beta hydrolase fold domain-containing protein [Methanoculleus sp.]